MKMFDIGLVSKMRLVNVNNAWSTQHQQQPAACGPEYWYNCTAIFSWTVSCSNWKWTYQHINTIDYWVSNGTLQTRSRPQALLTSCRQCHFISVYFKCILKTIMSYAHCYCIHIYTLSVTSLWVCMLIWWLHAGQVLLVARSSEPKCKPSIALQHTSNWTTLDLLSSSASKNVHLKNSGRCFRFNHSLYYNGTLHLSLESHILR